VEELDKQEIGNGVIEGLVNTAIALVLTYGIHRFVTESGDLPFALAAAGFTAFFTGYFTLTTGGVSVFGED